MAMEIGAAVWVLDDTKSWREASVVAVDAHANVVECALDPSSSFSSHAADDASDDHHVVLLDGNHTAAHSAPTHRRRRNSRAQRRNSLRRIVAAPLSSILLRNASESYAAVEDLTKLVHLHEPAILAVLRHRFVHGDIYTSTGSILVALNPFRRLSLYSDALKASYYAAGSIANDDQQLPPHVYAVADKAFRTMLLSSSSSTTTIANNQTILVSGESGAGKTETTKLIMNYLAFVSNQQHHDVRTQASNTEPTIHERVLESNPILEAFGNARTTRNNNSSRFGKFIQLGFRMDHSSSRHGAMLGAIISTYLLERVRLVTQAKGERNYHIFYELLAGASAVERDEWKLKDVQTYAYLNQSGCFERLDGVDDAVSYQQTRAAMTHIGMAEAEQGSVLCIVSAVLHLGDVVFMTERNKDSAIVDVQASQASLEAICSLLGVDPASLHATLCTKQIKAGAEFITMALPVAQAQTTRDAVVKTLYSNLFAWLVARINRSIAYDDADASKKSQFIGVVDIFGFEIFESNSLEQLCINYANEKLQQLFSTFVFAMEQATYVAEQIPWTFVDFPTNDQCVLMLERRAMGLFSLLDEQCLIPKGNDQKLANKFYESFAADASFSVSRLQKARAQFVICHYAGDVCYTTQGFCEKNKDHMHTEAMDLLKLSHSPFVRSIFEVAAASTTAPATSPVTGRSRGTGSSSVETPPSSSNDSRRRSGIMSSTVVTQFKTQLSALLDVLNATAPHFVRCIKPNDDVSPQAFRTQRVLEQLRCSGVLEAVKISRSGYPIRFPHAAFLQLYSCIVGMHHTTATHTTSRDAALAFVAQFTTQCGLVSTKNERPLFQVGKTKVFCVPHAHALLETKRALALFAIVQLLQRHVRGFVARRAFERQRHAVIQIQTTWRRFVNQRRFRVLITRQRSVIAIQAAARGWHARRLVKHIHAITTIQSFIRGWLVRREYSANTLSFDHDVSFVGLSSTDQNDQNASFHANHHPLVSLSSEAPPSSETSYSLSLSDEFGNHEINDPDGRYGGNSDTAFVYRDSKKRLEAYEPPTHIPHEYEIVWECGLLGLYFESDPISGMPIVRRVHESLSNCADIFEVSRGDVLLAVGNVKVKKGDIRRILSLLQEVQKPVRLHFLRSPTESFRMRSGSIELLGEEDYEVLWKEGVPLGLGFRPDAASGYPCVMQANGNQSLPGMFNVRIGDFLIFINEFSTQNVRFQKVIDILESGPRPAVLRFRHNDLADDFVGDLVSGSNSSSSNPQEDDRFMRQSCLSLNPKVDHSLYYITWKEDDGPLGIVVKQESTSYYPRVINVKNEGAVTRESQKNRVEVGDVLLSINNNNISKMGFGAAMRLLQKGPKPLLLMFQRPRESFSVSLTRSMNL